VWYVTQQDNRDADHPTWIPSSRAPTLSDVIIEQLSKPSIKPAESTSKVIRQDLMIIDELEQDLAYDWMHPIKMFLEIQPPLNGNAKVEHIAYKSKRYHLVDGILF
jgi:hypothetical protein